MQIKWLDIIIDSDKVLKSIRSYHSLAEGISNNEIAKRSKLSTHRVWQIVGQLEERKFIFKATNGWMLAPAGHANSSYWWYEVKKVAKYITPMLLAIVLSIAVNYKRIVTAIFPKLYH